MKFVSGTSSIPPLGLPGKLKVLFKHWYTNINRSCKCKPTVSTCALSLTLAVHYNNKQGMKEALTEAAWMSQGFGKQRIQVYPLTGSDRSVLETQHEYIILFNECQPLKPYQKLAENGI